MEQAILTTAQKIALATIGKENNFSDFYLSGGTALAAFYFQHRLSDDLDFFSFTDTDNVFLHGLADRLKIAIGATAVRYERPYDRNMFFFRMPEGGELKVEFTKYPFRQLEETEVKDGIRIDSIRDIAANKLMALVDRFDPKDFVDLYFLLQRFSLDAIRSDAEKKFNIKIGDIFLGSEFAKVKRIEALPKMVKPLTIEELKHFFSQHAKTLASVILE